ncbi:MAG: tol-pal system protein YbgF [Bacteroidota bacterium]|nr:tol-pal system protein YbgF [Kiloniellaceae bacterium]
MTSLVRSLPRAVLVAATLALAAQPAAAQSVDSQLQRLQRELSDLQRQVYGGATPPAGATGGATQPAAAQMHIQLNELEAQVADLTGRIEDLGFRLDSVTDRLDRLVADVDLRLRNLEEGGLPPVGAETPGEPGMAAGAPMEATPPAAGGAPASPTQPGTIGSLRESDLSTFQQQQQATPPAATPAPGSQQSAAAPAGAAALPGGTPQEQYDYAFGLLRQANYAGAEQAFSAFLAEHANHALAGNAKYWLGETYYVRGDYQQAAVTFAEGFEAYPNNSKAPDNLLKLGMSLASLGSTQDACGTFDVLLDRYADAPATILSRAQRESQRLSCP